MNISAPKAALRSNRRQTGVAAIELAILMPIILVFLTIPFFYARCFWHYTAAQKAAQNATLYLSSVSAAEMRSNVLAKAAGDVAVEIAKKQIAELAPGSRIAIPQAYCDDVLCGDKTAGTLPTTVHVNLTFNMFDDFFNAVDAGRYGIPITANFRMRYVGN
jgi:Flp pilus assembly protein TadG